MTIDLKSIAEKGNYKAWGDLFVTKKLNESTKPDAENGRFMKELIGNPLSMGIDPVSDLYLFFQYSAKSQPSFGIAFAVRNESDLENVLMKIPEKDLSVDKKEVQNKEGYKLFHFSKGAALAWKKGAGLFATGLTDADLDSYVDKIMKQEKSASLAERKDFLEFTQRKQDIGIYINYAGIFNSSIGSMATLTMQSNQYIAAFKTASVTMSILFEKDKIAIRNFYQNSNPDAFDKYSFIGSSSLTEGILKSLTPKPPLAFFGFTIDMKKLFSLLTSDLTTMQSISGAVKDLGVTPIELGNLLGGELAATLNDFKMTAVEKKHYGWDPATNEPTESMVMDTTLLPEFSLTLSINDKAVLQKLLDHFKLPKDNAGYYKMAIGSDYYLAEDKTGITLTNSKEIATELTSKKEFPSIIGGKAGEIAKSAPTAFYLDLTLNDYPEAVKTYLNKLMKEENYKQFTDFMNMFVCIDGKGSSKEGEMNIRMSGSDENSLWRTIKQSDNIGQQMDIQRKKTEKERAEKQASEQANAVADSLAAAASAAR
jgi:hypothetical protein